MLTDQDINKLRKVFATKDDLSNFATKDDLVNFATKDDLVNFATKDHFFELKEEILVIKENVQGIVVAVDDIAKKFDKLDSEYFSIKNQINRHEKWHHQTADKIGINLEI